MSDDSKPEVISFEDFLKIDLRIGTILSIEPVPKSKKLLKLEVNFGTQVGKRIILAGLAPLLDPLSSEQLGPGSHLTVGQQVTAVLNLAPRTMMGIESHGMILAVRDEYGRLWTLDPAAWVPEGSEVG